LSEQINAGRLYTNRMSSWNRRQFLAAAGAAGISAIAGQSPIANASTAIEDFAFLFITDTHIQPELNAAQGCAQCFRKARTIKSDFVIQGGDHIFDGLAVDRARATSVFDLYGKTEQDLGMKIYHTIGNHDCFGVNPASGVSESDPSYGKKMYTERFGTTYYSFDHKGVHFIVLDSIGITGDRAYEGRIDAVQLAWLKDDLAKLTPSAPVVVSTHIPLVTGTEAYMAPPPTAPLHHGLSVANAYEVIALFEGRNVLGVLQGHLHFNETILWKGVPYMTNGAVSGNWWHGTRLGTPEGFTVVQIHQGKLATRYETYGFHTVDPQNT
jgi:3',5'-cyclic-AMP phosphodiesterase